MAQKRPELNSTGLRSLELYYEPITNMDFRSIVAYRSSLRINSPDLGVILPSQYQPISQRSVQCEKLGMWALDSVTDDIKRLEEKGSFCEWLSIYIPIRLLCKEGFMGTVVGILSSKNVKPEMLCFEIPGELLFEDPATSVAVLTELRAAGIKTMLTEFGGQFSPLMRLSLFPFDFVTVDGKISYDLVCGDENREALADNVLDIVRNTGAEAVAGSVNKSDIMEKIGKKCSLVSGPSAGKPRKIGGIRN